MTRRRLIALTGAAAVLVGGQLAAEPAWGPPNKAGLVTRLVPLGKEHEVGKAIAFRLEVKNTGAAMRRVDVQSLAHPECQMVVKDAKGAAVPSVSAALAGCQTTEVVREFPPGKTVVVLGNLDAGAEFEITKEGTYRFRYPGLNAFRPVREKDQEAIKLSALPPSPEVELKVKGGKVPVEMGMIGRLRPVVPKDWVLCYQWRETGVYLGTHGPLGAVGIELDAVDARALVQLKKGQRVLGTGPLGKILMIVSITPGKGDQKPPTTLDDHWPGAEAAIRKALEIEPADA